KDHLAVLDLQAEQLRLPLLGALEPFGGVVVAHGAESAGELEDVAVSDGEPASSIRRAYTCSCRRVSVRQRQRACPVLSGGPLGSQLRGLVDLDQHSVVQRESGVNAPREAALPT